MTWNYEVDDVRQLLTAIGDYLLSLSGSILFVVLLILGSRMVRHRFALFAARRRFHASIPALFDNVVKAVVYVIIGFMILGLLGVNTRSLATFAGLVTAALTLSLQDVFKNIFCGFYLLGERPFSAGDRVRVGSEEGTVERIDLRVTRIRNDRQELVLVPNSIFFSQISIARATMQRRSLTVRIEGMPLTPDAAEEQIGAAIAGDARLVTRLLKVGPAGCDFEVTVSGIGVDDEPRIIAALGAALPDATVTVVAR